MELHGGSELKAVGARNLELGAQNLEVGTWS